MLPTRTRTALAVTAITFAHLSTQASALPFPQLSSGPSSGVTATTTAASAMPVYLLGIDITAINKLPNWAFNLTILGLVLAIIGVFLAVYFACQFLVRQWRRSAAVAMEEQQQDKKKMTQLGGKKV